MQSTKELQPLNPPKVKSIAKAWVNQSAKIKKGESVMIYYDVGGRQLAKEVAELCTKKGCRVWYRVREMELDQVLLKNSSPKNIERYHQFLNNEIMSADSVFIIRCTQDVHVLDEVPQKNMGHFSTASSPILMDYRVNFTNWQLIYWPTEQEAKTDGMTYEEYTELFFNACNQDWAEIKKAQNILIKYLNGAKQLTLIADPNSPDKNKRTHITMSIEGMEFKNSTIDNNFPGSEVFSSPVKESVNGQIYCAGHYDYSREGVSVEDMLLIVKNGKIIRIDAKKGAEKARALFDRDEGASYFGEVAFGTNPGLRRRLLNPLLEEKVGGSFHITPGRAYDNEVESDGSVIHIDNGNKSSIHWDMTIMMLPEYGGGEVIIDGKTIQKDGKWLIKGLEVLNRGI